jgi:hypothetical protein
LAVALWVVLSAALWVTDASPAVLVLGAIVAVLTAIFFVMVDFGTRTVGVVWLQQQDRRPPRPDRDARVTRLVQDTTAERSSDSSRLHDTLVELVDDRLATHHDIDRALEPEAAMAALSPALRRLVAGPRLRNANARTLRRILSDIEAL